MTKEEGAGRQPNTVPIKFYRGIKSIANFLKLTPRKGQEADPRGEDHSQGG